MKKDGIEEKCPMLTEDGFCDATSKTCFDTSMPACKAARRAFVIGFVDAREHYVEMFREAVIDSSYLYDISPKKGKGLVS